MKMKVPIDRRGSSLAESMVALGLVVVGLLGIVVLSTRSLALNRDVVNRTIAAGLAAEGIEVVKNIIDIQIAERGNSAWGAFLEEGSFGLDYESVVDDALTLPPPSSPLHMMETANGWLYLRALPGGTVSSNFSRTVSISFPSPYEISVRSVVGWSDRGTPRSLEVEDHFFNWRP